MTTPPSAGFSPDCLTTPIVPRWSSAVLEGVAFAFADCRDALGAAGTTIAEADVIGGGSRSRLWIGVLASVLGIALHRVAEGETGGAFGAARLARLAVTGEDPSDVCAPPERVETILPDPALVGRYQEALAQWRALYPALRGRLDAPLGPS